MSTIEQPNSVDAIGVEKRTGIVVLTIFDHLNWKNVEQHLLILQEKINNYIAFIESGELVEKYPDAAGRTIRIDVLFKYKKQPEETIIFMKEANKVTTRIDVTIVTVFAKSR